MSKRKSIPKLTDVAELAGVSIATASIVLNDPENHRFSKPTANRVLQAARELKYLPAAYAQQMKGKNPSVIGLIIPDLRNHYYPELTCGFTDMANSLGYNIILLNSNNDIDQEAFFIKTLIGMHVAGVALCGVYAANTRELELIKRLTGYGIPVVRFDRYNFSAVSPYVGIDNYLAGYCMTEKLIQSGHRSIACFLPEDPVFIVAERYRGYQDAMQAFSLMDQLYTIKENEFGSVYQNLHTMWHGKQRATAIFAAGSDMNAIECIKSAASLQIDVPGELSIAGFDDIYLANVINPPLTTIRQPKYEIGETAMRLLKRMIDGEDIEEPGIILPFEYVSRGSTRILE